MSTYDRFAQPRGLSRNALIAIGVVLLHVGALWALQTGLLRRAVEIIVPATLLTEYVSPPAPVTQAAPPPQAQPYPPQQPPQPWGGQPAYRDERYRSRDDDDYRYKKKKRDSIFDIFD